MRKKLLVLMLALVMVFQILPASAQSAAEDKVELTILATSDTHANLYGYSYEDDKETTNNGLARVSTYVNELRSENPNVILIDNGDTYQGNILSDAIYNKKSDVIHPVSKAFNSLKYDALVLGNHEFNFGESFVERIIKELEMPVLGANFQLNGKSIAEPYTIVERSGVKVGIIGLTNPNVPRWDGDKVANFTFESVATSARKVIDEIKDKVDLIVVSAHVGMEPEYDLENGGDSGKKILELCPEVDVLILGHFHTEIEEKSGKTLIGSVRNNGRDVAEFDITLQKGSEGFEVIEGSVKAVDMKDTEPDEALRKLIEKEHLATIDFISGGGGESGVEGGGIFGKATADFQPVNEIKGIPEGKLRDTAVIDLVAKVQLEVSGADVTSVALFKDDSDLHKGDINYGDLFNIYKFDNTLYTVEVTGLELKNYMEWSAEHYNTWKEGDISISFNEDVPGYRYDMFEGVSYEIDLSKPQGERIKNVMYKEEPLKDDEVLTLAVNNYRYSSGLKANKLVEADRKWESPKAIRDYIAEYIQKEEEITPFVTDNWKIVGIDLEHPLRDDIIALVNADKLEVPYNKSLNITDLESQEIIKDGAVVEGIEKPEETKPTPTDPIEEKTIVYNVVKGDYLKKIAKEFGVNYMDIANDNNIKNPNRIYPNQKLTITVK